MSEPLPQPQDANQDDLELVLQAFKAMPCGVVVASTAQDGRVHSVNDAFTAITGYRLEDIPTVSAWLEKAYPDAEYRARVLDNWNMDVQTTGRDVYYQVRCADGSDRMILLRAAPLRGDRMVVTVMDMSAQTRAVQDLRESEERFRGLSDTLPVGMVVHTQGQIVWANRAAERMAGGPVEGDDVFSFVHPVSLEVTRARIAALYAKSHDVGWIESIFATREGIPFPVEVAAARVSWKGKPAGLVLFNDIRARKAAEEERLRLERRVQEAQRAESLALLAGGVAHDFNNLLVGIMGNADLALHELSPDAPIRSRIEGIDLAARRAADLALQMLAYSGRGRFMVHRIDVNTLIQEMGHLLSSSISKKATLQFHLEPHLPPVRGDGTQLRQVVMNLITNASEALGDQGGTVHVSTGQLAPGSLDLAQTQPLGTPLDAQTHPEGLWVWFQIADTGCGMDPGTQSRIFEPFFTTKFTGRGLGLAAVQGIVRGHQGAIRVQSTPGQGTTFRVYLPADTSEPPPQEERLHRMWEGPGMALRILVVDDEPTVREVCADMLRAVGHTTETAPDGRTALELFERDPSRFDLVLLDLSMPDMDGQETFLAMRRARPDIRVLLCSGFNEQDTVSRFAGTGLAGFIQKPYHLGELLAALQRAASTPPPEDAP